MNEKVRTRGEKREIKRKVTRNEDETGTRRDNPKGFKEANCSECVGPGERGTKQKEKKISKTKEIIHQQHRCLHVCMVCFFWSGLQFFSVFFLSETFCAQMLAQNHFCEVPGMCPRAIETPIMGMLPYTNAHICPGVICPDAKKPNQDQ